MQFRSLLLTAAAVSLSTAQDAPSIADALSSTDQLSQLNTLLGSYPDLVSTLGSASNITVLAPSNSAFQEASDMLQMLNESDPSAVPALLMYHVLNMTVMSDAISSTPTFVPTLLTNETYTNVTGGQVVGARLVQSDDDDDDSQGNVAIISGLGQRSQVTMADIAIANGVVHIIDSVLTLPAPASDTAIDLDLTALAGALISTDLVNAVDTTPDVTIFAPNNDAFADIASALGDLTTEQAAAILQYHVVNGTIGYSNLLTNTTLTSLTGQPVNITVEDGEVFVNSARVVVADVLVANGVVHVIDSVLNPNSTQAPNPDEDEGVPAYSGASSGMVPYTSMVTATTTVVVTMTDAVASGYTPAPTDGLSEQSSSIAEQQSMSTGGAPMPTGAIGAAALFGGAAFLANM